VPVLRGDVYWVDWTPARGSEHGVRPALIVQNDVGNRASSTTVVAAMTSRFPRTYPFMVLLDPTETGLPTAGVVNLSRLLTISQARLLPPRGEQIPRAVGHDWQPQDG